MKQLSLFALLAAVLLAACSSGPVRRVSEPAASIQQLTVDAHGNWSVDVRVQNYSSIAMRFERLSLSLQVDEVEAGTLEAGPELQVSRESADVVAVALSPSAQAKLVIADALAAGRAVSYRLEGSLSAAPSDRGSAREYDIRREGRLSPVPGLPGVLR